MTVESLRAFVAVADEGTFTDAALALGTSQAAVSRRVAALEDRLGVRLLQRGPRGATPTATGTRLLAHARRVLDELAALERVAADAGSETRVGFAWSALGRHTTTLQRRWVAEHPGRRLVLVQAGTPSAGLLEGLVDVAVVRREVADERLRAALVGVERRLACLPSDDPLARRRVLRLADFDGRTVAVDLRTGTTTRDLWPAGGGPATTREVHGVDEWLTAVAAGEALGLTSEATAAQFPRPGVVYRPVQDAPPVPVHLVWWHDDPPSHVAELVGLVRALYAAG
ncbi:LysR family transcriptional regulator [Aquipuribacter sp. SD81]|uniref:LysR family transcriptional regulator n=1 Tax=Aquipuribacter sp. SD81 TaxID=3127703 RepID=UPI003016B6C6